MRTIKDVLLAGKHAVINPYPGRKLYGVMSVEKPGKIFCFHEYQQVGYHPEISKRKNEPIRVSIRHYQCDKCQRMLYVFGPEDEKQLRRAHGRL